MTIYIDADYMCHLESGEGRTEVQTDSFDGAVRETIPYYRYIPQGAEWVNPKTGATLHGLFIQCTDSNAVNRITQNAMINDMQNALSLLGVNP